MVYIEFAGFSYRPRNVVASENYGLTPRHCNGSGGEEQTASLVPSLLSQFFILPAIKIWGLEKLGTRLQTSNSDGTDR